MLCPCSLGQVRHQSLVEAFDTPYDGRHFSVKLGVFRCHCGETWSSMLQLIEFLAVVSGAVFGALLARRKQMDFVGVFSVAFITAFGGGTLRDILLDRHPLFWIANAHYPVIVFILALIILTLGHWIRRAERWLDIPDALGLGLFSIVGAGFALEADTSLFIASLFGVITGTFGGVIGDVVCNEVPNLFRPKTPLYATCGFVGCWAYMLLGKSGVPENISLWTGISVVVAVRMVALRWNIRLPGPAPTSPP